MKKQLLLAVAILFLTSCDEDNDLVIGRLVTETVPASTATTDSIQVIDDFEASIQADMALMGVQAEPVFRNDAPLIVSAESSLRTYELVPAGTFSDFAIGLDVQRETESGGCSILIRGDEDFDTNFSVVLDLAAVGNAATWQFAVKYGEFLSSFSGEPAAAAALDPAASNHIIFSAVGDTYTLYAKGQLVDQITFTSQTEGQVALGAFSTDATTSCKFSNVWIAPLP